MASRNFVAHRPGLRCWIRGHDMIRELDAERVWSFACQTCGYRTPIVRRTADERDALAKRYPRSREGRAP